MSSKLLFNITVPQPQAPPQHNDLMTAFEQAMANQNHQLGKTLERMGMSMAEFVEHMKDKDKKPVRDLRDCPSKGDVQGCTEARR